MSKIIKGKPNQQVLFLLTTVTFFTIISTYLYSGYKAKKEAGNPVQVSTSPSALPTSAEIVQNSYPKGTTYQGDGFTVDQIRGWYNLKSDCQQIIITKSDVSDLKLTMNEYILKKMGFRDIETYNEVIDSKKTLNNEFAFELKNISNEDALFYGPDGEGDLNNIFIRGPQGYYHAHVIYIGSVLGNNQMCLTESARNEYKYILSSFEFTQ